jgi:hypothetical protein
MQKAMKTNNRAATIGNYFTVRYLLPIVQLTITITLPEEVGRAEINLGRLEGMPYSSGFRTKR